jgi:hypothetical protein
MLTVMIVLPNVRMSVISQIARTHPKCVVVVKATTSRSA